jgi:hypothetical protein
MRSQLESLERFHSLPTGLVRRAEVVLLCAQGLDNGTVAEMVGTSRQTVGKWRRWFRKQGLIGLYDETRPMSPQAAIRVLVVAAMLITSGCEVYGPDWQADRNDLRMNTGKPKPEVEHSYAHRFSVKLDVRGDFRPGRQVQVVATVHTYIATEVAEIRLTTPELDIADPQGWNVSPVIGSPIPARAARSQRLAEGSVVQEHLSLTFPQPGYYRVVASVVPLTNVPLTVDGRLVQNVSHIEGWMWITESGGRFTKEFDRSVFPSTAVPVPGPLRQRREGHGSASAAFAQFDAASATGVPGQVTYQVNYLDHDANAYLPVRMAGYQIQGCTVPVGKLICDEADWQFLTAGVTSESGILWFPCEHEQYRGWVNTANSIITISPGSFSPVEGSVLADCGLELQTTMGSGSTRSFIDMVRAAEGSRALLGVSRPHIIVTHDPNESTSYYLQGADRIVVRTTLGSNHVWGQFGIFVAGHEYGHAVHHKALGGIIDSYSCPSGRRFDARTSFSCAFVEGFATYHAVAVRDDLTHFSYRSMIAANAYFPGCTQYSGDTCIQRDDYDGAQIEPAVAAFLYDVSDPANDPLEPFDQVAAPGAYIRDIITSCQVQTIGWTRATGVDHLVYCMENAVTMRPEFRPVHGFQESATESAAWGWSPANIRALWRWNLFGEN